MKKVLIVAALAAFFIGCAGVTIQTSDESNEIIVEMAARRVTYHVALENPEMIEPGLAICDGVLAGDFSEDPNKAIAVIVAYLADELDDPLLEDDLNDLMRLMNFEIQMPEEDLKKLRYVQAAAKGIRRGLQLAGAKE